MTRALVLVTLVCIAAFASANDQPSLGFYIVSQETHPGLHFFDSAAFPKLGYIGEKPDLPISNLESISVGTSHDRSRIVHRDGSTEETSEDYPALNIRLTAADAKSFEALTSAHIGSRILLMDGNDPLFAPVARSPITGQDVQIRLPPGADAQKIREKLQVIVRKP